MRYWDSSALLPILVAQEASDRMRNTAATDAAVTTWWATPVECASGLARLLREGRLDDATFGEAMVRLRRASTAWADIAATDDVREQAIRVIRLHAVRSADALQLAAAIVASDFRPATLEFVTLDTRLAAAAANEGFRVII